LSTTLRIQLASEHAEQNRQAEIIALEDGVQEREDLP